MSSKTQATGQRAEKQALKYLRKQGLKLITRNYSTRYGEIDLIMSEAATLVFVEVRFRNASGYGTGADSVTRTKQVKIIKTAEHYLQKKRQPAWDAFRFDVISMVTSGGDTQTPSIDWIPGAFTLD